MSQRRSPTRRKLKNAVFSWVCAITASISVLVLAVLLISIAKQGYVHLLTRAPGITELHKVDWTKRAKTYAEHNRSIAESFPEPVRSHEYERINHLRDGLIALNEVNWTPIVEQYELEELDDLEDVDWEEVAATQNLPDAAASLFDLTDDQWTDLVQDQRIFALSALKEFVTEPPSRHPEQAGIGPAMWGTVWICLVCACTALPIGIATAIFLEEYKPSNLLVRKLHDFLQLNITNLAGVPSIVYGIIGLTAFVHMFGWFGTIDQAMTIGEPMDWYHFQVPFGRGVMAGGLTLMLVILPIVVVSSQEAIRAVPDSLREGALACGATKWQMIWKMTLPASIPGIMTGSILAMSRAIGEAAPILVIAGIVFIRFTPQNLVDQFTAMPLQIYNWAGRPQQDFWNIAATGIIILLAVLLTFNATAVFIRQKFSKPLQ